ncbi:MAG TPA: hypothetical protein DIU35_04435 [Candidatus Latescibacteria bacterium]|nr:hypothetical protein [Gemmatimonadota bacterium]HCR16711.1 hypothetical protein [Candidatus Latescibacterota bacterium]
MQHPEVGFTYSAYRTFADEHNTGMKEIRVSQCPSEEVFRRLLLTKNFICRVVVVARTSCYRRVDKSNESLYR